MSSRKVSVIIKNLHECSPLAALRMATEPTVDPGTGAG
jgi:hypothetical protein